MKPIVLEVLSAVVLTSGADSRHKHPAVHRATSYSASSSQSPAVFGLASGVAVPSFQSSLGYMRNGDSKDLLQSRSSTPQYRVDKLPKLSSGVP